MPAEALRCWEVNCSVLPAEMLPKISSVRFFVNVDVDAVTDDNVSLFSSTFPMVPALSVPTRVFEAWANAEA
jgi:hypothetical protein